MWRCDQRRGAVRQQCSGAEACRVADEAEVGGPEACGLLCERQLVGFGESLTAELDREGDACVAGLEQGALKFALRFELSLDDLFVFIHDLKTRRRGHGGPGLEVRLQPGTSLASVRLDVDHHTPASWQSRSRCQVGSPYRNASVVSRRRYRCWS